MCNIKGKKEGELGHTDLTSSQGIHTIGGSISLCAASCVSVIIKTTCLPQLLRRELNWDMVLVLHKAMLLVQYISVDD